MFRLITAAMLSLFLAIPTATLAQDVAPEDLLPPSGSLQGDWTLQATNITPSDPSAIAQLAQGIYLGPEGSRATVLVGRIHEGPAAARTAWDLFGNSFDGIRVGFDADYGSERDLANLVADVPGCADMRRMNGTEEVISDIPVGVSLCAADPDLMVLVYASGTVNGRTGHQASDALVALALNQGVASTPTP